ncbi:MAG: methyl-accepting chemotaxis protein [Pseudomonadota bacterium]
MPLLRSSKWVFGVAFAVPVLALLIVAGANRLSLQTLNGRLDVIDATGKRIAVLEEVDAALIAVRTSGSVWEASRTRETAAAAIEDLIALDKSRAGLEAEGLGPLSRRIQSFADDATRWVKQEQEIDDALAPLGERLIALTDALRGLSTRADRDRSMPLLVAANRAIAEVQTSKLLLFSDLDTLTRSQTFAVSQGHLMAARAFLSGSGTPAKAIVDELTVLQSALAGVAETAPEPASGSGFTSAGEIAATLTQAIAEEAKTVDRTATIARSDVLFQSSLMTWIGLAGGLVTIVLALLLRRTLGTSPPAATAQVTTGPAPDVNRLHRRALDSTDTLIMLADNDRNIVYLNTALETMFRDAETDIRQDLPQFEVGSLIGSNIDAFHRKADHQSRMIADLTHTHRARFALGGRHFDLAISPINGSDGDRIGTVVEWQDRTQIIRTQAEIDRVVTHALHGDFKDAADLTDAPALLRTSGEQINQLVRSIDENMTGARRVITAFARGNLTERMRKSGEGAFKDLREGVNETVDSLSSLVRDIKDSVETMHTATDSIADGAEALAARAVSQASRLQETAATMEEMSATIKSNADSADSARSLAVEASSQASKGGSVVDETISAMTRIETSSGKISDIISVIDSIAFQTNLLALNAAVEAARAGDAGKGFAVVASEVRTLAQRSAEAAKDIKSLISESTGQVADGVSLVHRTGSALTDIVGSVKRVADTVEDISTATKEQSSGIAEIASAVNHMDQMTQQNSSMAEQSAAAARNLAVQSGRLSELVSHFTLADRPASVEAAADAEWRRVERRTRPEAAQLPPPPIPSTAQAIALDDDEDWASF